MHNGFSFSVLDGWHAEEHDGRQTFRWTSATARSEIRAPGSRGTVWLRLSCGMWGAAVEPPLLTLVANGAPVGQRPVSRQLGYLAFPLGRGERFAVELHVDRTFCVPSDGRTLGVMMRDVEVFDEDALTAPLEVEGWYDREHHEYFPFCWMGGEARLLVPDLRRERGRFVEIPVSADADDGVQHLRVSLGERDLAELPLRRGWHVYDLEVPSGEAEAAVAAPPADSPVLTFRLDALRPASAHPPDPRPLGVRVGPVSVHDDRRRHVYVSGLHAGFAPVPPPRSPDGERGTNDPDEGEIACGLPTTGEGWNLEERDEHGLFRWMKREAALRVPASSLAGRRYCRLPVFSAFRNLTQELTVMAGGEPVARLALLKGWHSYSLALPPSAGADLELTLRLNKLVPAASHESDPRELGARVGGLTLHDDGDRHERDGFVIENAARNQRELQAGATVLSSFPQTLGIDLYGRCNIKPACVYCLWDRMKALEGETADAVVDDHTLASYGDIFSGARLLVNCSFGEPLLHPRLGDVLDLTSRHGKVLELSSNGQAFNARTIRSLAGRHVHLYVSLDAATAATYARLRNDRWDEVLAGLMFLRDARQANGGWPRLNMVFMPMRANIGDLEQYFRLCRLVEATSLVLRPLLYLEDPGIEGERGGYRFEYERELMTRAELEPVFADCERYSARYRVTVISQFDFGLIDASRFQASPSITEGS